MIIDNYLDRIIGKQIEDKNNEERANHKSSGKLSASMLGQPLQWQILKVLGVPQKEIDEYTLRKFKRGNDVEDWFLQAIPNVLERQKFVEYRNVVGYPDGIVNTIGWDFASGIMPIEVKSVSNLKFKRIVKEVKADRGHSLQGALYALSEGTERFAVSYIATDDYRIHTFILETKDFKEEVDKVIDRFDSQLATGKCPIFVPEEKWQANPEYNNYPDWSNLSQEEVDNKLQEFLTNKNNGK